ncbi:hypothetical protein Dimus_037026 [Dionaea muscipula]
MSADEGKKKGKRMEEKKKKKEDEKEEGAPKRLSKKLSGEDLHAYLAKVVPRSRTFQGRWRWSDREVKPSYTSPSADI